VGSRVGFGVVFGGGVTFGVALGLVCVSFGRSVAGVWGVWERNISIMSWFVAVGFVGVVGHPLVWDVYAARAAIRIVLDMRWRFMRVMVSGSYPAFRS
jgi:hypothetical protein